jgi:hypothetical protein
MFLKKTEMQNWNFFRLKNHTQFDRRNYSVVFHRKIYSCHQSTFRIIHFWCPFCCNLPQKFPAWPPVKPSLSLSPKKRKNDMHFFTSLLFNWIAFKYHLSKKRNNSSRFLRLPLTMRMGCSFFSCLKVTLYLFSSHDQQARSNFLRYLQHDWEIDNLSCSSKQLIFFKLLNEVQANCPSLTCDLFKTAHVKKSHFVIVNDDPLWNNIVKNKIVRIRISKTLSKYSQTTNEKITSHLCNISGFGLSAFFNLFQLCLCCLKNKGFLNNLTMWKCLLVLISFTSFWHGILKKTVKNTQKVNYFSTFIFNTKISAIFV